MQGVVLMITSGGTQGERSILALEKISILWNSQIMKVFIFGAGASVASQGLDYERGQLKAPFSNELADPRYSDIARKVGLSLSPLASLNYKVLKSQKSLEQCLTEQWNEIDSLKIESSKEAERKFFGLFTYYLWRLLQDVSATYQDGMNKNIYRNFVMKLIEEEEEFGFINFNYDTLLDQAYQETRGIVLANSLTAYTKNNYIKPHGSVNWFLRLRDNDPRFFSESTTDIPARFERASALIFNPEESLSVEQVIVVESKHMDLKSPSFIASDLFEGQYAYPLLFLPLISKQYDWVQGFYEKIIQEGRQLLEKADEIYLIGYRAKDDIVRELFTNVQPETIINVVGSTEASEILSDVLKWKKLKSGEVFHEGFESFVDLY